MRRRDALIHAHPAPVGLALSFGCADPQVSPEQRQSALALPPNRPIWPGIHTMALSAALAKSTPNYAGTRSDWQQLATTNPQRAASIAHSNSSRLANVLMKTENVMTTLVEMLAIGGFNIGFSYLDGRQDYKRNVMVDEWRNPLAYDATKDGSVAKAAVDYLAKAEMPVTAGQPLTTQQSDKLAGTSPFKEGGFKDPVGWFGLPWSFWATLPMAAVSYFTRNSRIGYAVMAATVGTFTSALSSFGHEWGMKAAHKAATAAVKE